MIANHLKWYHFILLALAIYFFNGWVAGLSHIMEQVFSGNIFGEFPGVMWPDYDSTPSSRSSVALTIKLILIPVNGMLLYYLLKSQKLNFMSFLLVQASIDVIYLAITHIFFYSVYLTILNLILFNIIPLIITSLAAWNLLIRFLITEEHNYIDSWINKLNKSTTLVLMLLLLIPELLMVIYWMIDIYLIPDEAGCFGSLSITGPVFSLLVISLSIFLYLAMRPFLDKEERNRILMADIKVSFWPTLLFILTLLIYLD